MTAKYENATSPTSGQEQLSIPYGSLRPVNTAPVVPAATAQTPQSTGTTPTPAQGTSAK